MKKRIVSLLLTCVMLLGVIILPTTEVKSSDRPDLWGMQKMVGDRPDLW